jgi:Right handed beta helix region/Secretion system C-terminal sorting domain
MFRLSYFITILIFPTIILASIHHVPTEFESIQLAVNIALDGDTVLVSDGVYFENVQLRGHNIVLASEFLIDRDLDHIVNTIIDGSQPVYADTASCILIISGEDSTTFVSGFTLRGGTGTPLWDPPTSHFYREGGGILIENSSPTIEFNLIYDNEAIDESGDMASAGGGGIRLGFGSPVIKNNVIIGNRGLYGGGVVVNYADPIIKNNIIADNSGGQDFGGAGLWMYGPGHEVVVENNTIVGNTNSSGSVGGGVRIWSIGATLRNNIVWANYAPSSPQISGNDNIEYCLVQDGITGTEIIEDYPEFVSGTGLLLGVDSPAVDSGNPDIAFNDIEDSENPGLSLLPSMGNLRSDIGAYGGSGASFLPQFDLNKLETVQNNLNFRDGIIGVPEVKPINFRSISISEIEITSVEINLSLGDGITISVDAPFLIPAMSSYEVEVTWNPVASGELAGSIDFYHTSTGTENPVSITVEGEGFSFVGEDPEIIPEEYYLNPISPNPFNAWTVISFGMAESNNLKIEVYDILGHLVSTVVDDYYQLGHHMIQFNADSLAAGTYFIRMQTDKDKQFVRKAILLK